MKKYWNTGRIEEWNIGKNREEKWMNLSYSWVECSLPIIPTFHYSIIPVLYLSRVILS